jgi:acetyltransferase-like isoleucine patch superfamily enzyme
MFETLKKFIIKLRDLYLVNIRWKRFHIGSNFHAGRNVAIWAKDEVVIGNNCYIGRNTQIECNVKIGNEVLIANNVAFIGRYDHNYQQIGVPIRFSAQVRDKGYTWLEKDRFTIVADDVWIGYGAIILSGVVIKTGSIVAAGSVVTRDVEAYSIYGGSPAKKISERFTNQEDLASHKKRLLDGSKGF